jgi:hypothetical protein
MKSGGTFSPISTLNHAGHFFPRRGHEILSKIASLQTAGHEHRNSNQKGEKQNGFDDQLTTLILQRAMLRPHAAPK